jgi:prepilin-type N-terminal cleavage/methylation domain-containing protein/prepilin-type processing-associated H-X9-DG protein
MIKMTSTTNLRSADQNRDGFTLIELVVVIAALVLLALTLLPALASSKTDNRALRCLNNQRQLMSAIRVYTEDYNDYLPANDYPWTTPVGSVLPHSGAANWAPGSMIVTPDRTNTSILRDPVISQLYNYLRTSDVFKCPADPTVVIRSLSMNSAVGTRWYNAPPPKGFYPLDGAWLSATYTPGQTTWRTYNRISTIVAPNPANLWVLMEEHPDSINDSSMATPAVANYLIDWPASYHNGAGNLVFADGHAVTHRWLDKDTLRPITGNPILSSMSDPGNVDTAWLAERTSAHR